MIILKATLTTLLSIIVLFFLTKLMGDKQMAQMSMFDYITGITIGSAGAEMAIGGDVFWPALVATVLWGIAAFAVSEICNKSVRARHFINGKPTVLFMNGVFFKNNMSRARMDMGEFLTQCRNAGFFSLEEISSAVMESNGKVSFLEKTKMKSESEPLSSTVVVDGEIMKDNLLALGKDEKWLQAEMKKRKIHLESVMVAMVEKDELFIYPITNGEKDNIF